MRITLILPPDGLLPAVPYASLAVLPACLERAGHTVSVRDLSVEVFEHLADAGRLGHWMDLARKRSEELGRLPSLSEQDGQELWRLQRLMALPTSVFEQVGDSRAVMRDVDRLLDPESFNQAFDGLRAAYRFALNLSPNGLAATKSNEHSTEIQQSALPDPPIDLFRDEIVDSILADNPELIGVSLPYDSSIFYALKLMRLLKDRAPQIPIIVGGAALVCSSYPLSSEMRFFDVFDYVMMGEGEETFPAFATALEAGEDPTSVDNLGYPGPDGTVRNNKEVLVMDLDTLPSPDYTKVPLDRYLLPDPVATFQTSRGCYYGKCTFCSDVFRRNYRMRDPALVVDDMVKIYEDTGIRRFQFWDALAPPATLRHISLAIAERKLDFHWMAETKFERPYVQPGYIETLARGGCKFLFFGFESGASRVLARIDKGNDLKVIDEILSIMQDNKIKSGLSWFIGFPSETPTEANYTYDYLASRRDRVLFSNYSRLYDISPDTIVYENQEAFGIKVFDAENGKLDYRYEDGSPHYDRTEMDQAYFVRCDFHALMNHVQLHYSLLDHEQARAVTWQVRMGPLLRHVDPIDGPELLFQRTAECNFTEYDRNPLKGSEDEKLVVAFQILTGHVYVVGEEGRTFLSSMDEPRTLAELSAQFDKDVPELLGMLEGAINRGLVKIICDESAIHYTAEPEEAAALAAAGPIGAGT